MKASPDANLISHKSVVALAGEATKTHTLSSTSLNQCQTMHSLQLHWEKTGSIVVETLLSAWVLSKHPVRLHPSLILEQKLIWTQTETGVFEFKGSSD